MPGRALPPAPRPSRAPLQPLPAPAGPRPVPLHELRARRAVAWAGPVGVGLALVALGQARAPEPPSASSASPDLCRGPHDVGLEASVPCTWLDAAPVRGPGHAPLRVWLPPARRDRWLSWRLHEGDAVRTGTVPAEGPLVIEAVSRAGARLVLAGPGAPTLAVRGGEELRCVDVGTLACSR
ncbi:MAG: hypothetical protein H6732_09325 [Alphaproteobacteria bacterium]|nr:hypothetical protein [Alphaproteobacteria bacterium]